MDAWAGDGLPLNAGILRVDAGRREVTPGWPSAPSDGGPPAGGRVVVSEWKGS